MPTKNFDYLRVSTDKQADRGVSLDAQLAKLKAYAELYELDLVEVIVDAPATTRSRSTARACSARWGCSRQARRKRSWW